MTSPLDDVKFEERLEAEVARETRRLRNDLDERSKELAEVKRMLGFHEAMKTADIRPPKWTVKPHDGHDHRGIIVAQLTDTHFDEVVKPDEVLGLNAYNRRIAEMRLERWARKVVDQARNYVGGVTIDGCVVMATGDILSGDIHEELKQSNEDHLYASVIHWVEHLIAALDYLADDFGKVHVYSVVGNHGRSTRKPVYKGRAHSNIEWLLWRVIASRMASDPRLTFTVSDAMDLPVTIYGKNLVLTHGDQFHGGSGISGALAPLMLGTHRKGQRQAAADIPMDLMVLGHFHQYLDLPGVIVGGSMKGYDEFAFGNNFRPDDGGAKQALWVMTPEYGKTMTVPIFVQDRKAEGW